MMKCVFVVKGVVSGELCQQQEHGLGEGGLFTTQRNLPEGTHLLLCRTGQYHLDCHLYVDS